MRTSRFLLTWTRVHTSLWFLPTVLTLAACVLAMFTIWLDQTEVLKPESGRLMLTSGAEGARGVLSTIAGSIITVTGVVFSITIVVLQLASSQFSPRVLRSFTEDRAVQLVLGVFIGTFTYALLVLRTVRSEFADYDRFVPWLSVNIAMVLALVSMGFLIYFVSHIAHSIQAETIIGRVTADALEVVDKLFPQQLGEGCEDLRDAARYQAAAPSALLASPTSGFLRSIDADAVMRFAEKNGVVLRLEHRIGSFIVAGDSLISVIDGAVDEESMSALKTAVDIGAERTRFQDVERGLIELIDIAVRALSPGTNDPTTALVCIHRLTEIFTSLGGRRFPSVARADEAGNVRVIAPRAEFEELIALAYGQIREHSQQKPTILDAMLDSLTRLEKRLPASRVAGLREEQQRIRRVKEKLDPAMIS